MEYRSVRDLNDRIIDWSCTLPRDIDLIVGIPRSGLLAANLLGLHLDLPVTDLDGFLENRILSVGQRYSGKAIDGILRQPAHVLVVDDSSYSGASLDRARQAVNAAGLPHRVRYGAVFVTPQAVREGKVELFAENVPGIRVFEWNILHTPMMRNFCVDIDGVLCMDPSAVENDDGSNYRTFLQEAAPRALPRYEIGWLVTSRLEKYRSETQDWLQRHGIRYRQLLMMDYPDQAARQQARAYDRFKADAYLATGADLFIESAPHTAAGVASLAGKPVFCFDTREMMYPGEWPRQRYVPVRPPHPLVHGLRSLVRLPLRVARKGLRTALGG